jgi:cobalamin biosynthetic protein CobC
LETFTTHGGRLAQARRRFVGAVEPWIDLSTGVNPRSYPARPASSRARARLPDPEETAALEAVAAEAFGIKADAVLATPGVEAAIRLLAGVLRADRVGIVEPTYGGHAGAWRVAGAAVTSIERGALPAAADLCDVVVVVNPNNPDGATVPAEALLDLADRMEARGGWLVVDEAYVDASPEISVLAHLGDAWRAGRLIVFRSFGKFYGLPGLRLGFVAAKPDVIVHLRINQGEWPVSADAITAGLQAYPDGPWADQTRRQLVAEARRLDDLLIRAGLEILGGTSLFRLAAADDAQHRFLRMAQAGVLTRPFDYAPTWLRLGLPDLDNWPRVEAALMESAP